MEYTVDYFLKDKPKYIKDGVLPNSKRQDRLHVAWKTFEMNPPKDPGIDSQARWEEYVNGKQFSVEELIETIKYCVEQASYAWDRISCIIDHVRPSVYDMDAEDRKLIIKETKGLIGKGLELVTESCDDIKYLFSTDFDTKNIFLTEEDQMPTTEEFFSTEDFFPEVFCEEDEFNECDVW